MNQETLYKLALEAIAQANASDFPHYGSGHGSWCKEVARAAVNGDEAELMELIAEMEQDSDTPA